MSVPLLMKPATCPSGVAASSSVLVLHVRVRGQFQISPREALELANQVTLHQQNTLHYHHWLGWGRFSHEHFISFDNEIFSHEHLPTFSFSSIVFPDLTMKSPVQPVHSASQVLPLPPLYLTIRLCLFYHYRSKGTLTGVCLFLFASFTEIAAKKAFFVLCFLSSSTRI